MPYKDKNSGSDTLTTRVCKQCTKEKLLDEYYVVNKGRHRTRTCKLCYNNRTKLYKAANPEKVAALTRASRIRRTYGITAKTNETMLILQNYRCAICREKITKTTSHIDHDHVDNTVRGILCPKCNMGLGLFNDNVDLLELAVNYLRDTFSYDDDRETQ